MVAILREREDLSVVDIVEADALTYDYDRHIAGAWCACGNLPYNVGTALLLRWLQLAHSPDRIVVMVQRDVAGRLTARPNSPSYGSLTLFVGYRMRVRRAFLLSPGAFYPRPKVDSAVVVMERYAIPPVNPRDPGFMLELVRAGFAYRRKALPNSLALALGIERSRTQEVLGTLGFQTEVRAEQLDLDAFAALADGLAP